MRHSRAPRGVYITKPERTIWPVIALVATMLFSAAAESGASFVRGTMDARSATEGRRATAASGAAEGAIEVADAVGDDETELGREQHAPAGAIKAAARTAHLARNSPQKHRALPDARAPLRRATGVVLARSREVADRRLVVRSFRQTVISPRSGGLIRYFPTAPPPGEVSPSPNRLTSA